MRAIMITILGRVLKSLSEMPLLVVSTRTMALLARHGVSDLSGNLCQPLSQQGVLQK